MAELVLMKRNQAAPPGSAYCNLKGKQANYVTITEKTKTQVVCFGICFIA